MLLSVDSVVTQEIVSRKACTERPLRRAFAAVTGARRRRLLVHGLLPLRRLLRWFRARPDSWGRASERVTDFMSGAASERVGRKKEMKVVDGFSDGSDARPSTRC
jgi:hypothetical protein